MFVTLMFSVRKHVEEGEDGILKETHDVLAVGPLETAEGYNLAEEDPKVFDDGDDPDNFNPQRVWPHLPLPQVQASIQSAAAKVAPTSRVSKKFIKHLLAVHHSHVQLLKSLGVNACEQFQQSQAPSITVIPGQKHCKFCDMEFAESKNLHGHLCHFHSREFKEPGKPTHKCIECGKIFGLAYSLKLHKHLHEDGGRSFKYPECPKSFISVGKLNEHAKQHKGRVNCSWCPASLADPKQLGQHQKVCRKCPGAPQELVRPFKCDQCGRAYTQKKGLHHHIKNVHL